jgi:hypothetical protein
MKAIVAAPVAGCRVWSNPAALRVGGARMELARASHERDDVVTAAVIDEPTRGARVVTWPAFVTRYKMCGATGRRDPPGIGRASVPEQVPGIRPPAALPIAGCGSGAATTCQPCF